MGHHGTVSDFLRAPAAYGREVPNPASVHTREDLARQLTLLRLSTPSSRPGKTLTMRELSDRSDHTQFKVAHSTIGNAESGSLNEWAECAPELCVREAPQCNCRYSVLFGYRSSFRGAASRSPCTSICRSMRRWSAGSNYHCCD